MISIREILVKLFNYDITKSKSANGRCKNVGCWRKHRIRSAYCQRCSDKWHKNKREFEGLFKKTTSPVEMMEAAQRGLDQELAGILKGGYKTHYINKR